MTTQKFYLNYHETYEYQGNTAIEITRKQGGFTIERDWLYFDSVEEAEDFFYETYNEHGGYHVQHDY